MKIYTTLRFIILCLFMMTIVWVLASANIEKKGRIIVKIDNCRSDKGKIMIALYSDKTSYMNISKATIKKMAPIEEKKAVIEFESMPYGKYAFVFFHDENSNQKLDKNLLGIPKEGVGFSKNVKGTFGPPSFEKSAFELGSSSYTTQVKLGYY